MAVRAVIRFVLRRDPGRPSLDAASDSGVSSSDGVTNFNNAIPARALSFTVRGAVPGATVTLYADGVPIGIAVVSDTVAAVTTDGTTALADGAHLITAPPDAAGWRPGDRRLARRVDHDRHGRAVRPGAPDLQAASDTGASSTDNLTKVNTPTLDVSSGVGGSYYRVFRDGALGSGSYEASPSFTSAVLVDGTYSFTARSVDAAGNESPAGPALSVVVDTAAPAVTASDFRSDLHALSFVFSKDVGADPPLAASVLMLVNLTTGRAVDPDAMSLAYDPATLTGTWTFPGLTSTGGRLPDGNYRATLPAGSVNDAAGNPLATDYTFEFFVLAGDANHDRVVDVRDLGILAQHYGQSGPTIGFEDGDFNGDGVVDVKDLGILAQQYGRSLAAP